MTIVILCLDAHPDVYIFQYTSGHFVEAVNIEQCDSAAEQATCSPPQTDNTTGTHYYKNTTEVSSDFKCDWVADVGYTEGSAASYTPTAPAPVTAPAPAPSAPRPVLVPFSPITVMGSLLLLLGIVAAGLRKRWNDDS